MKKNMGTTDRVIRILLAAAIAGLYFAGAINGTLAIILFVIAGILVLTSFVSFCPLYWLFMLNTSGKKHGKVISYQK